MLGIIFKWTILLLDFFFFFGYLSIINYIIFVCSLIFKNITNISKLIILYSIWTIVNISRLKFGPPKSNFLATPLRIEARSMVFTTRLVVDDLREDLGRKWEERLVLRLVSVGGQKHLIDVLNKNSWTTQLISKKWERRIHNEKNKKLIKDKK